MMGGSSFDTITQSFELLIQEVSKQQRGMEQLEEENQELRRQLAALREGRGIFLEIAGRRFPLIGDSFPLIGDSFPAIPRAVPAPAITQQLPDLMEVEEEQESAQEEFDIADAPTTAIAESDLHPPTSIPEMPVVASVTQRSEEQHEEQDMEVVYEEEEQLPATAPTFLEEMMLDEFADAVTSPLAVWTPPAKKQEQQLTSEEERNAALRKELAGSFLLE